MKQIRVKEVVKYGGHSLSANGSVNLTLKADYSELVNTIQVQQMLNNDVKIKAKLPNNKPMWLGMFRVKSTTIDGDGESTLKFNSLNDYVEMDNLNLLPTKTKGSDEERFIVLMEVTIEEEEEGVE